MKYLRLLLFPFSLIYGLVVIIRNWCYDAGFFKTSKFSIPIISVGNLEVGGAGKSPMTEYLIRLFKEGRKLATLSRGYGRETKGYLVVNDQILSTGSQGSADTGKASANRIKEPGEKLETNHRSLPGDRPLATQIGDEPAQFTRKFPEITVAVCEDRVVGIKRLLPDHDLILMDDAYQHRAVEPGLSILLFDYTKINKLHLLLPAGNMREPFSGRWRAQLIIVSKCPPKLSEEEQAAIAEKIKPMSYQELFFTAISYMGLRSLDGKPSNAAIDAETTVFLLTGIANAGPLLQYLSMSTSHIIHHKYADHHPFTLKNISKLVAEYEDCNSEKKLIITTEKDAQRLQEAWFTTGERNPHQLPVFMLPIQVAFLNGGNARFDEIVNTYVREHTAHN